jgi:nucleoside-diphosphate-sugar epimerase
MKHKETRHGRRYWAERQGIRVKDVAAHSSIFFVENSKVCAWEYIVGAIWFAGNNQIMVIGSGMLARAFDRYRDHQNIVVLASGVSDSTVTDVAQFEREQTLLVNTLDEQCKKQVVYFSTCSIVDPELSASPYVNHKLKMEGLIQTYSSSYLVFRLPQVVGHGGNKNTLTNRLFTSIRHDERFQLWRNADRYIIDVDDVSAIASYMIDRDEYVNRIINVASCRFSIFDIARALENVTQRSAIYTELDKGASYSIDCEEAHKVARLLNLQFDEAYLHQVIRKYYAEWWAGGWDLSAKETGVFMLPSRIY